MKKTYKAGLIGKRLNNSYSKEIYTQMFDKIEYKNYVIKTQEELDGILSSLEEARNYISTDEGAQQLNT
jgi:shikimate 5-dehydrogenase